MAFRDDIHRLIVPSPVPPPDIISIHSISVHSWFGFWCRRGTQLPWSCHSTGTRLDAESRLLAVANRCCVGSQTWPISSCYRAFKWPWMAVISHDDDAGKPDPLKCPTPKSPAGVMPNMARNPSPSPRPRRSPCGHPAPAGATRPWLRSGPSNPVYGRPNDMNPPKSTRSPPCRRPKWRREAMTFTRAEGTSTSSPTWKKRRAKRTAAAAATTAAVAGMMTSPRTPPTKTLPRHQHLPAHSLRYGRHQVSLRRRRVQRVRSSTIIGARERPGREVCIRTPEYPWVRAARSNHRRYCVTRIPMSARWARRPKWDLPRRKDDVSWPERHLNRQGPTSHPIPGSGPPIWIPIVIRKHTTCRHDRPRFPRCRWIKPRRRRRRGGIRSSWCGADLIAPWRPPNRRDQAMMFWRRWSTRVETHSWSRSTGNSRSSTIGSCCTSRMKSRRWNTSFENWTAP